MKRRNSLNKAEWSNNREDQYRKDCEGILFRNGEKVLIVENEVYLISGEQKLLLMHLDKPKSTWYEIWPKLKNT